MDEQIDKVSSHEPLVEESPEVSDPILFNSGSIVLDKYLVIKLLGRGGMGSVYQVRDLKSRTEFALKFLNSQHRNDVVWRRFDNEARAANRLDHPNLIKVHDSGLLPNGQPYFVMDLVHGVTLADQLKEKTRLPLEHTLKIMIQVAFAMAYAHDNGVVHRDIKPSNIMIGNDLEIASGNVKLVDFGIAKLTGQDNFNQLTLTRTGEIFGSPLYMSPEQCAGTATDHRSDLYSFGCVLYETLTGAPPILADNALATMMKHQHECPVSMKQASLGVTFPGACESIVAKLLEKSPEQRYQNAHELVAELVALEQYLLSGSSEPSRGSSSTSTNRSVKPRKNSFSWGHASAPISVLLLIAGFSIGFFTGRLSVKPEVASQPPAVAGFDKGSDLSETKDKKYYSNADELNTDLPFSALASGSRIFNFPKYSFGTVTMLDPQRKKKQQDTAQGLVVFDNFVPLNLKGSDYLYRFPQLISRFRTDELESVELANCDDNLEDILHRLVRMKTLKFLSIADTSAVASALPIIDQMKGLIALDLSGMKLAGSQIAALKILPQLEELKLTNVADPKPLMAKLKQMPNLRVLHLSRTALDKSDVMVISNLKKLSAMDLTDDQIIDDKNFPYIASLPLISALDLEHCPVTPSSIETISKMHNLVSLHLSSTGWSHEQMNRLKKLMSPRCLIDFRSYVSSANFVRDGEAQYEETLKKH